MFRRSFLKLFSLLAAPKLPSSRPLFQTVTRWKKPYNHRGQTWMYYAAHLDAVPDETGWTPTVLARHRLTEEPKLGSIVAMHDGAYRFRITEVRREPKLTPQDEWRLAGKSYEEIASLEGQKDCFTMWSDPTD